MKRRGTGVRTCRVGCAHQRAAEADKKWWAQPTLRTGFTLVEMLVALAITSTIATIVYGSYAAASRSLDLYGSRMACCERTSLVMRLMARQIRCAWAPPSATGSAPSSQENSVPSTPSAPAGAIPQSTTFHAASRDTDGTILSFVTTGGLGASLDKPTPLSHIMYRYDPANGILGICCVPYVNGTDALASSERWQPILSGVRRVGLQFYDGQRWRTEWDGSDSMMLPQAVRIAFTIVDNKDRSHEFQTTVPIGCRNAPQRQQVASPAGKL